MERRELKKLLIEYAYLLTRYQEQGNTKQAKKLEETIQFIQKQLNTTTEGGGQQ